MELLVIRGRLVGAGYRNDVENPDAEAASGAPRHATKANSKAHGPFVTQGEQECRCYRD